MRPRRAMWYVRRSWRCLCHFWSHWIIQRAWEEFKIHLYGTLWAFQGIQNGFHENNLFPQNTVIQRPAKMIMPMKKMKTNCCSLRQGRVGIAWWRKELLSEPNWRFPGNMQKLANCAILLHCVEWKSLIFGLLISYHVHLSINKSCYMLGVRFCSVVVISGSLHNSEGIGRINQTTSPIFANASVYSKIQNILL